MSPEVCPEARKERQMKYTKDKADAPSRTHAESARVETGYETLDSNATKTAFEELDKVLHGLAEQVIHTIHQITPHLAEMQSLLSQRGKTRKTVLKSAGLPSWTEYARGTADMGSRVRGSRDEPCRYHGLPNPDERFSRGGKEYGIHAGRDATACLEQDGGDGQAVGLSQVRANLRVHEETVILPFLLGFLFCLDNQHAKTRYEGRL